MDALVVCSARLHMGVSVMLRHAVALQVQSMDYDVIVFDTAPTGHTLRLLNFPTLLEKGLAKLMQLKGTVGSMMGQVGSWQHVLMHDSCCYAPAKSVGAMQVPAKTLKTGPICCFSTCCCPRRSGPCPNMP